MSPRDRGYVVDGRFLAARPTGLHRVARSFVTAAREAGTEVEVWAPSGTVDPLVDRVIRTPGNHAHSRVSGRVWEQIVLPAVARGRPIWSLTNTAPLLTSGVVVVHDLAPNVGPQWFARSMRTYAATVVASARRARLVITVSETIRGELVNAGVRADRIVVVAPAVDPGFTRAPNDVIEATKRRFGLGRPYALLTGWSDPRKDAQTAVAAHQRVVADMPHDLVLTGVSHPTFAPVVLPDLTSLRRTGHVSDGDLVALISGAAVLLYPSRYEGYGLPPLEALSCGTPAVASDIPVLRESTAGLIPLVAVGDTDGWAAALRAGLSGELSCPSPPPNSQAEMGRRLAAALSSQTAASPSR